MGRTFLGRIMYVITFLMPIVAFGRLSEADQMGFIQAYFFSWLIVGGLFLIGGFLSWLFTGGNSATLPGWIRWLFFMVTWILPCIIIFGE